MVAEGLVLNVLFAKVVSRRGYAGARAMADRLGRRARSPRHDAVRIAQLVAHAAPLTSATCVPRSLTTFTLLRRAGFAPVVRFGVADGVIDLVDAHTWVEVDGHPVGETAEIERYLALTSTGER